MKCPYCAEEIQDQAVMCRFCFAMKEDGVWNPPHQTRETVTPQRWSVRFTMGTAATFFVISALSELANIKMGVHFFGSDRTGLIALMYHLIFSGMYFGLGAALWAKKPWGYHWLWGSTILYSIERALYLMTQNESTSKYSEYGALFGNEATGIISGVIQLTAAIGILAWWGFLLYAYLHRDYFQIARDSD